jgi:protein involved in polysaccharide export with SLBB domain
MFNSTLRKRLNLGVKLALLAVGSLIAAPFAAAQNAPITPEGQQAPAQQIETVKEKDAFGSWIFGGEFANQSFVGFNPTYTISAGDKISLRLWGGFEFEGNLVVDAQGNIFVPKVGPVRVLSVRNRDINQVIGNAVRSVFKKNVNVYASLGDAEPVKIFVTGFVMQPGLFAGHSSDSVLYFLDQAGGIDSARGSFLDVRVLRGGKAYRSINLYDFILAGNMPQFQLADGDTIVVSPVMAQAAVLGEVQNENLFEFAGASVTAADLMQLARPQPHATHFRINRNNRQKTEVEYLPLTGAADVDVFPGDALEVTSDKARGTISVRVEGEHESSQEFVLPYGARLGDLLSQVRMGVNAQPDDIQLMRKSVKIRQKETLEAQLRALESSVLTARSNTTAEAKLRQAEADLILRWVERARKIEPKGQVSLSGSRNRDDILLEPGDIIRIPRRSNLVMVHGDVLFPSAMAFQDGHTIEDYINLAGGFTQSKRNTNVLVLHLDGTFKKVKRGDLDSKRFALAPGDEIMVLPRVATKHIQIATDVLSVFYQLAVSAKVLLDL